MSRSAFDETLAELYAQMGVHFEGYTWRWPKRKLLRERALIGSSRSGPPIAMMVRRRLRSLSWNATRPCAPSAEPSVCR